MIKINYNVSAVELYQNYSTKLKSCQVKELKMQIVMMSPVVQGQSAQVDTFLGEEVPFELKNFRSLDPYSLKFELSTPLWDELKDMLTFDLPELSAVISRYWYKAAASIHMMISISPFTFWTSGLLLINIADTNGRIFHADYSVCLSASEWDDFYKNFFSLQPKETGMARSVMMSYQKYISLHRRQ